MADLLRRRPGGPLPADFIARWRKAGGWSVEQLAYEMGLKSKNTVWGWESGAIICSGPAAELFMLKMAPREEAVLLAEMIMTLPRFDGHLACGSMR